MKKIIWVYNVVLSHGLLLHAPFPSLIKLMNTARHVREWHKKNKELIYSSREPPSPKTKATISPLPGLDNCLPKQEYKCVYALLLHLQHPTLTIVFPFYTLPSISWPNRKCTAIPPIFRKHAATHHPPHLRWLSTKCTLTPQWLAMRMWGRIKKLSDRCPELIMQLHTEPRPVALPQSATREVRRVKLLKRSRININCGSPLTLLPGRINR